MHPVYPCGPVSVRLGGRIFQTLLRTRNLPPPPLYSLGERLLGACGGSLGQDVEGPQTQASYLSRSPLLDLFGREKFPKFDAWPGGRGWGSLLVCSLPCHARS